jgi:hypothetical protein
MTGDGDQGQEKEVAPLGSEELRAFNEKKAMKVEKTKKKGWRYLERAVSLRRLVVSGTSVVARRRRRELGTGRKLRRIGGIALVVGIALLGICVGVQAFASTPNWLYAIPGGGILIGILFMGFGQYLSDRSTMKPTRGEELPAWYWNRPW